MKIPKIFIGTMACGEAEYEDCLNAIYIQKDVDIHHYIIKDKLEKEAHEQLFLEWNKQRNNFDVFIKIDADEILTFNDKTILKRISDKFEENQDLTGMQLYLFDYYTQANILGLTCLRNTIELSLPKDKLKPDRAGEKGHKLVLRGEQVPDLMPVGFHCYNPSDLQAFHYGLHRTLKDQFDKILLTNREWKKHNDSARKFVLLGSMASVDFSQDGNYSYKDKEFLNSFKKFSNFSEQQQKDMIKMYVDTIQCL